MSKALVIKGANFLANRVEQISVSDPIPCTGIALSQNTLEFTQIGATATLVATLTPADTTEALSWVSSDEDVATVSNGVVTCTGVGAATVTAMCGEQLAMCEVTSTVTEIISNDYTSANGYRYSGSVDIANNKDWIGLMSGDDVSNRARIYYSSENYLGGYRAFLESKYDGKYLIPIPRGATSMSLTAPSSFVSNSVVVANSLQKSKASGTDGECASAIATAWKGGSPVTMNLEDKPNANGFIVSLIAPSGKDPTTITGDVTVTFS